MTERPLLMLDVDGVLNPWMMPKNELESGGFRRWQLPVNPGPEERTYAVWLNPLHGKWLGALDDVFELTWCTTWWRHADDIASRAGLPLDLPAVPLPHPPPPPVDPPGMAWKTKYVREYAQGRSVAWLDDDFEPGGGDARALTRTDLPDGHPLAGMPPVRSAMLLTCKPWVGLTRPHVYQLGEWAQSGCPPGGMAVR